MKTLSKTWVWISILSIVTPGCDNRERDRATITINSTTQLGADVKVTFWNLEQTTLIESKTDSTGFASFEMTVHKPIFVVIQIGKKYGELYLGPGYDLVIKENGQDYKIPLTFSGEGAEINNYVSWVNSNVEKIKWANKRGIGQLGIDEFLHRFDSLKTTINDFHETYIDSVTLPNEIVSMLQYKNSIKFLEVGQEYKFLMDNSVNEKWEAYRNGQNYIAGYVSKELENLTNEIPFDTTLLTAGCGDYQILLNFYWHNNINLPVSLELVGPNYPDNLAPLMTNALIEKGNYPDGIREFLIAFNLQYWLSALGITPETDSVFASFKRVYQNSDYLPVLNKNYLEWLTIAPGKPAPEFVGYSQEGKKISIKDLRGKIVYIDVWATWCAPCIAEIPASNILQKELMNEDQVQFLNVSVDSRRSDWENFLKKDKAWKGLHIIIEQEMIKSFYAWYKIFGVPNYILIDRSGNIVNMKASRPSEGKIKAEIKQLLAKGKSAI